MSEDITIAFGMEHACPGQNCIFCTARAEIERLRGRRCSECGLVLKGEHDDMHAAYCAVCLESELARRTKELTADRDRLRALVVALWTHLCQRCIHATPLERRAACRAEAGKGKP